MFLISFLALFHLTQAYNLLSCTGPEVTDLVSSIDQALTALEPVIETLQKQATPPYDAFFGRKSLSRKDLVATLTRIHDLPPVKEKSGFFKPRPKGAEVVFVCAKEDTEIPGWPKESPRSTAWEECAHKGGRAVAPGDGPAAFTVPNVPYVILCPLFFKDVPAIPLNAWPSTNTTQPISSSSSSSSSSPLGLPAASVVAKGVSRARRKKRRNSTKGTSNQLSDYCPRVNNMNMFEYMGPGRGSLIWYQIFVIVGELAHLYVEKDLRPRPYEAKQGEVYTANKCMALEGKYRARNAANYAWLVAFAYCGCTEIPDMTKAPWNRGSLTSNSTFDEGFNRTIDESMGYNVLDAQDVFNTTAESTDVMPKVFDMARG